MLITQGGKHRFCNSLSRRSFLKTSALGLGGLSLAQFLRGEAQTPAANADVFAHKSLLAQYESFDSTGCWVTDVLVQGNFERDIFTQTGRTLSPSASVLVSIFNICTFESPMFGGGDTIEFQMQIDPQLAWATLTARSIPCFNLSTNGPFWVDINLSLTATAPTSVARDRTRTFQNGAMIIERSTGLSRPASCIGTVSVPGGDNFTIDPAGWIGGEIDDLTGGQIVVLPPTAAAHF